MDTFDNVKYKPTQGLDMALSRRVKEITYGDGYKQVILDGINTLQNSWSVTWANRSRADANAILNFLQAHLKTPAFYWGIATFPGGGKMVVRCEDVSISEPKPNYFTITATIKRDYVLGG